MCQHNILKRRCSKCGGHRLGTAVASAPQKHVAPSSKETLSKRPKASGPPRVVSILGLPTHKRPNLQGPFEDGRADPEQIVTSPDVSSVYASKPPATDLTVPEDSARGAGPCASPLADGDTYLSAVRHIAQVSLAGALGSLRILSYCRLLNVTLPTFSCRRFA